MKFTLVMPVTDGTDPNSADDLAALARAVETAGFDAIAYSEHPAPSRKWLERGGHETFDPLVGLAFCAAVTRHVKLMPLLLVLPYRNPLLTAKSLGSLDVVSQGRAVIVAGAGYLRSEFLALGVDFDERNELLDEAITVLGSVWTDDEFRFKGRRFTALGQALRPRPVQRPRPPIWIGGNSARAKQRAVALGDGWSGIQADPTVAATTRTSALASVDEVVEAVREIREQVASNGRDPALFTVQLEGPASMFFAEGLSFADRVDQLQTLANGGVDRAVVHPPHGDAADATKFVHDWGERLVRAVP